MRAACSRERRRPRPAVSTARGHGAEWWITDPYSFGPVLGPLDDFLMGEGNHFRLYDKMART